MTAKRIKELLHIYRSGHLTNEEWNELVSALHVKDIPSDWNDDMEAVFNRLPAGTLWNGELDDKIWAAVLAAREQPLESNFPVKHRVRFLKASWARYAAIVLLVAATATFLYLNNRPADPQQLTRQIERNNILPGGNKALLTLADGTSIELDSAANGTIAQQGNTAILKQSNGSLAYQTGATGGEVGYNTISTPKGGQYQISLPDGSKAWINAGSSISFPTVFIKVRKVKVTGEVYLEVAKDNQKPFVVNINGKAELQVLGTSFNINAYENESTVNTTLIEGSVKIAPLNGKQRSSKIIQAGQQSKITNDPTSVDNIIIKNPNIEKITAWKNGLFNFQNTRIDEAMRQLERWYNIEVVYESGVPNMELSGEMTKGVTLQGLLIGFGELGLRYRLEGRKLVILR